jgi:hypothetical protein
MADFWEKFKRPWSQQQCRDRYVRGPKINYRQLGEQAGRPIGTLGRWSSADSGGSWEQQREQYQASLRTAADEKAIEKTSERLGEQVSNLAVEHFTLHKKIRQLASIYLDYTLSKLSTSHPEILEDEIPKLNAANINFWSLAVDRSVKGERIATGMEYDDLNNAIAAVEKAGYKVFATESQIDEAFAIAQNLPEADTVSNNDRTEQPA